MGTTVRHLLVAVSSIPLFAVCASASGTACEVARSGDAVELQSPHFVFRLSTARGLRAESWQNRLTGRTLGLGGGAEVEFDIGLPDQPLNAPVLRVIKTPAPGVACEAVFELASGEPKATVSVRYQWYAREPVIR